MRGDPVQTGDAQHDNARVLNDRRFIFEQIGDESQPCNDGTQNNINNNNQNNWYNNNNNNQNNNNQNNNNQNNWYNNNNNQNNNNGNNVVRTTRPPPIVPPACQDQNAFCGALASYYCSNQQLASQNCPKICGLC